MIDTTTNLVMDITTEVVMPRAEEKERPDVLPRSEE